MSDLFLPHPWKESRSVAPAVKKVLLWLLVAFVVYTIVVSPAKAADMTRATFTSLSEAGGSLGDFFDALVT